MLTRFQLNENALFALRRVFILLLALMLALGGPLGVLAEDDFEIEEPEEEPYLYSGPVYDPDQLVVGNPTPLSGNFMTLLFGYNTSDVDVAALLNGYNLIRWDHAYDIFSPDPTVVSGMNVIEKDDSGEGNLVPGDETGNRTYVFTLNDELKYSDGTPITAADYAFSILLNTAPAAAELGGNTDHYAAIFGVSAYRAGETKGIAGVRILNDYTLSLTVDKEYLPFYYELGYLRVYPLPPRVLAPGCQVLDDGEGAYIDGVFNSTLLQYSLLDERFGYVTHPTIVSGPYELRSYDPETHIAEFEINKQYLGNWQGKRPGIKKLTLKPADNETMIEELEKGEYGLLNKVVKQGTIQDGLNLVHEQNYSMKSYARTGMTFLSFSCEQPGVNDEMVRRAISYCFDKDEVVNRYCGPYGIRVDGYYGVGQWMVQVLTGALSVPYPKNGEDLDTYEAAWQALSMDEIRKDPQPDVEEAIRILEAAGWTMNDYGDPFDIETDDYRCRRNEKGKMDKLDFTLGYPQGNEIGEILNGSFLRNMMDAGIRLTLEPMSWDQILREFYRQDERTCQILYLGSNFFEVFDVRARFDPEDAKKGLTNYSGIADEELFRLACEMAETEPGDNLTYEQRWLAFQKRYQEVLPAIGVYSNAYFDFYTRWLQNYNVSEYITWTDAILYAFMSDPTVPDEEELLEVERIEENGLADAGFEDD